MSGPARAAEYADLADDPTPGSMARPPGRTREGGEPWTLGPVRQIHGAAALLAGSVLLDSGIEHYRGQYHNRAMVMPLVSAGASLLASLDGGTRREGKAHGLRRLSYGGAVAVGLLGTAFHVYNVTKKPGGLSWENLFYQAPLGAPAALSLSGLLGYAAEAIRDAPRDAPPELFGLPAGQVMAGLVSAGLMGTVGEVGLLHFRGNFQNPAMYLPVVLPPVAAALTAEAALRPKTRSARTGAKLWLGITAVLGVAGVGFHAYGVARSMGGWKNWRQNLVDGPPVPAPPSFTGLAIAGLAALTLLERHRP